MSITSKKVENRVVKLDISDFMLEHAELKSH